MPKKGKNNWPWVNTGPWLTHQSKQNVNLKGMSTYQGLGVLQFVPKSFKKSDYVRALLHLSEHGGCSQHGCGEPQRHSLFVGSSIKELGDPECRMMPKTQM